MKYLSPQFYIKSTSDDGHIEGYASVFNVKDEQGETVLPGAFKKSIESAMKTGKMPKMLWQHDARKPIGVWEDMYEDDHGLVVKGKLLLELKHGREAWSLLKNRAIDGLSIGYRNPRKVLSNSDNFLSDIDLLEISIVTFPACTDATIDTVKSEDQNLIKNKDMQFNDVVLDVEKKEEVADVLPKTKKSSKNANKIAKKNEENLVVKEEDNKIEVKSADPVKTEQRIDAFADLIKAVSRLTQMIYQLLR